MNTNNIDSLAGIDISKLTFSDIQAMFGSGRSIPTDYGREKSYTYRLGVQTKIGDIKSDVWVKLAEQLIIQAGEEDILARLVEYSKDIPWMKREPPSRIKEYALDLHTRRIFDNPEWVGFIPFNESWRPEALNKADIINVIPDCCQKPGRITVNQIQRYTGEETAACPHCGRFGPFQRIK